MSRWDGVDGHDMGERRRWGQAVSKSHSPQLEFWGEGRQVMGSGDVSRDALVDLSGASRFGRADFRGRPPSAPALVAVDGPVIPADLVSAGRCLRGVLLRRWN